ncbi:probable pleckstrin homology domain-containing family N member 1 [Lagopus leucura]|uniref:probable pleckstrin homology domain-containing family N member 1 n=1 Tax=Lagopus leucura TaxID=30410 RepID=UPI001C672EB7|nr:probable pleckstrin homology domain-containing family N member 1 [Lagopus leucura]
MGCCSLRARHAGSAGESQDEVELLKTGRTRKWSISDGQSEGPLQPKDLAIPTKTEGAEALWGKTQEELLDLLIAQPIAGWEGRKILSPGEIVWSSWVFLRSYHMEEMSERYLVLTSFHLLILSVDHTKKAFVYEGLVPLAGMHLREVVTAISCTFEISGPMMESRLICCQNSADFDKWIQHLQNQIKMANANYSASPTNNISFLVPCDEQWKKRALMRHLLCNTILKWEGKPIQHLGRIQHLTMVQMATGCTEDPKERLLILFPEDLLFLSVDEERTTVTYEGKLPLMGIQGKEKSTVLGRLQLEITGSLTEPILINCSTAEDYEKLLFHLQKPEKNLDTVTLQPPPIIPKKSWHHHQDVGMQ